MAKNISLLGADYPDVPAVVLPKTGGGSATFVDADDVKNIENALAIVIDGNTAPKAITSGQYLFIKNHSTLATGGYHAKANITSGGTISGSNVEADPDGISNTINNHISDLNNKMASVRIPHKTTAWAGTTVSFEIPRDGKLYRFTAMNPSGILCCAIVLMRNDEIKITNMTSNSVSQSYSSGVLTLTLPSNTYWESFMERLSSSHAANS